jgi:hypothetical protein
MKLAAFPDFMGVRAASLDDPSGLEPRAELWTCRAYAWDSLSPDLPHFEKGLTEEDLQALMATRR